MEVQLLNNHAGYVAWQESCEPDAVVGTAEQANQYLLALEATKHLPAIKQRASGPPTNVFERARAEISAARSWIVQGLASANAVVGVAGSMAHVAAVGTVTNPVGMGLTALMRTPTSAKG